MPRALRRALLAASSAALLLLAAVSPARASVVPGGPLAGLDGYYDYSATGPVRDTAADTETYWWCGDMPGHTVDTILEQQYKVSTWTLTVPERTALGEGPAGAWDDRFVCNPSNAIRGTFANPLGDGVTYTWALYYVGYSNTTGINQIGVAFSLDALTWHRYPQPVEAYPNPACGCYGYGQPNAQYAGGTVTLYYEESTPSAVHHVATSTDGVHFTGDRTITYAGLLGAWHTSPASPPFWGSIAYDPQGGQWYAAFNDGWRPPATTGGNMERGDPGCTLAATGDLANGPWTILATIDTVLTGYEENFMCGMLRDPDGTLSSAFLPGVKVLASSTYPRPAYNASEGDLGLNGAFNNWQIDWHEWLPGNVWHPLQRVDYAPAHQEVTTGWWDSSVYHATGINLGKLAEQPTGDATFPLFSCKLGYTDYFVAKQADCYGQYKLGLEGYAYTAPAADRLPLYRCEVPNIGDFVSTDPGCEGQVFKELLGYSQN